MPNLKKKQSSEKILIVGAGAIGATTGAMLHAANVNVCLVNTNEAIVKAIQEKGFEIEGYKQTFPVPIKRTIKEVEGQYNHFIVSVKSQSTEEVMQQLEGKIPPTGLVYSLQNGLGNTDIMTKYLPREQIIAGVVSWGASNIEPGKVRITSPKGDFVLGFESRKSCDDPRLLRMKKLLSIWKPTIVTDNILGHRWAKLIVNSAIATYGGLLGLTLGEMFIHPKISSLMGDLGHEGFRVADVLGIKLEKVAGLNIRNFLYKPQPTDRLFKRFIKSRISTILKKVGAKRHSRIRSTLLADLERGKKTEVEFINGYIVKKGKEQGLETPINSFLLKAIREIENGKRKIGLENLPELEEAAKLSREAAKR